ncbi:glycoside hydrolase family 13 protein [Gallaecimonas kandeliae]|uniref:glycoside hydrolase family 13 protein n=1 Tax=Gallaecimonas kandeliae TaxID=3029055 RepID=UPI0026494211|nr:glycoside hydrolase family 13 protein [Gallaecimonas kandeliae]WKE66582.1 glycoside hydrolase family 13 protein [Gallaecimonas kandeliae]
MRALYLPLLLALACTSAQAAKLDHIEPGNWWVGMHDPEVQLMVYGEDIGKAKVSLAPYAGVRLAKVQPVESPNYLFLTLDVGPQAKAGKLDLRFDEGGAIIHRAYPLWQRQPGSAQRQGFSAKDVIYLITPDRFSDGDPGNDNVSGYLDKADRANKDGRHGGDLKGIMNHLDYLQRLGVTQLWLTPVVENAMPSYSYHGYSATDFYKVDPRFGSNAQYRELAKEAKAKGLGLIIDVVLNHIGDQHPWVKDRPTRDWIHGDKFAPTNHRRETLHDPHVAEADQQQFNDGWFVPSMPDLNQRNPLLARYLIQNSIWWVEYAGLSGIRIDTWSYSDRDFLAKWSAALLAEYPHLNMVAEEWATDPAMVAYWQKGNQPKDGYVSNLPSLMDFPLQSALVKGLAEPESWNSGITGLYQVLADDFLYSDPGNLVVFADNHDMSRIAAQLHGDGRLWKMALTFILTTRGIPEIFYGTELAMSSPQQRDDGKVRADFPGGWAGDKVDAFTGKGLSPKQLEAQGFVRKLLNWRKDSAALTTGSLVQYVPQNGVYCYFREAPSQRVMVVMNKNDKGMTLDMGRFKDDLKGHQQALDVLTGKIYDLGGSLALPAKTALVLELK